MSITPTDDGKTTIELAAELAEATTMRERIERAAERVYCGWLLAHDAHDNCGGSTVDVPPNSTAIRLQLGGRSVVALKSTTTSRWSVNGSMMSWASLMELCEGRFEEIDYPVALHRCGGCDVSAGQPHHPNCAYVRGIDGKVLVQTPDEPRTASCVTRTLLELIEAYAKADARSPLNPDAAALRAEIVTRLDRIRDYADEPSGRIVRQMLDGTS